MSSAGSCRIVAFLRRRLVIEFLLGSGRRAARGLRRLRPRRLAGGFVPAEGRARALVDVLRPARGQVVYSLRLTPPALRQRPLLLGLLLLASTIIFGIVRRKIGI